MCGITGVASSNKNRIDISGANQLISHRGPDSEGLFVGEKLSLGHQRLSILDLSPNGHQPMETIDKSLVIVFNGEIYNHKEIRQRIKFKDFKSHTDTETILYAYKEFGVDVFKEFNGIFAFAIYDKCENSLILCRDHFGVKPLYYYSKNDLLIFGSEIKSFLKVDGWDKSIDYTALVNYLHFLWSPKTNTPFKYIKKLEAGHYVKIDLKKTNAFNVVKYYEIPFCGKTENLSEEEWGRKLDKTFTNAVKRQLLSDVPVGYFLSGGLDSSIIVAKAKELTGEKLQCYTIDTELGGQEGFANDLFYAKKVAKHLDVKLEVVPAKVDIVNDFDRMIWHLDEPQADAAPLNVLNICEVARRKGNKVLLGGAGGDDLFSGYRRHQALEFEKYFQFIPNFVGKGMKNLINQLPASNAKFRRIRKILHNIDKGKLERMAGYYEWLPLQVNKSFFNRDIASQISNHNPSNILIESLENIKDERNSLNQMLFWDMKFFLTDHNLNYTDKMSMAVGVEARVPFLDKELVELSTKIPPHLKIKGRTTKYLLKKMAENYLPNEVIYRPKTGFGAPVRRWITHDLNDLIQEYLSPRSLKKRGIFDDKAIWGIINDNKKGKIDASYSIWCLLAIESWFRQFVD